MNIFESLENLNVSEECFEDIVGLVEDLVSAIRKKYPSPYPIQIKDKESAAYKTAVEEMPRREELLKKATELERKAAASNFDADTLSKNIKGGRRTRLRSALVLYRHDDESRPELPYKTAEEKIKASIARHKAKQEKNK